MVLDASGASVAGAQLRLIRTDGSQQRTLTSDANGEFAFTNLPPGSYRLTVDAKGFSPFTSDNLALAGQQTLALPPISLKVGTATAEILVRPTEVVAAGQVKAEEKQRVLGVIPNFYTSFVYDAAPLTAKQKYSLAFHDVFDPFRFVGAGIAAGIEQANDDFAGYGQGAAGYGKRYAAVWGNGLFGDYLSNAVLPSVFHQDPRYFYQGSGSIKSRFVHAISFAVILRGDNGRPTPNYSSLLGAIGAGAISNLYYPHANRGTSLIFTNAAIGVAGRAGGALVREFVLKRFTTNVPGNGKP